MLKSVWHHFCLLAALVVLTVVFLFMCRLSAFVQRLEPTPLRRTVLDLVIIRTAVYPVPGRRFCHVGSVVPVEGHVLDSHRCGSRYHTSHHPRTHTNITHTNPHLTHTLKEIEVVLDIPFPGSVKCRVALARVIPTRSTCRASNPSG
ncbi:hypothetical protein EDB81DRAFT_353536 [Dactylonectria macrodidyma]|uniref:Uncharacterized protein n=1 Tax=Dactylonectria macrodidyma TaxID=307937 RepID=A0A9P9JCW5_9HYPO|nr:hypothetical protein EDB81DRAFT_353536 [Dactylonectria macrodidyma]